MRIYKRITAFILTLVMFLGILQITETKAKAAATVTMTTTMECSVWSAPNTAEVNRVKKIPAGYSVTVYPDVVQSTTGDGKTFYKTAKGCYILCKCFNNGAVQTGTSQTGAYQTPYNMSNITYITQAYKNRNVAWSMGNYQGLRVNVAVTYYTKRATTAKYLGSDIPIKANVPLRVWGYTSDGYYLVGEPSFDYFYIDDLTSFGLVKQSDLTTTVPSSFYPATSVINEAKPDADGSYYDQAMTFYFSASSYYYEYLQAYKTKAREVNGANFTSDLMYYKTLNDNSGAVPLRDYVYISQEGRTKEETKQIAKLKWDDYLKNVYQKRGVSSDYENLVLMVKMSDFTLDEFFAFRKEIYLYAQQSMPGVRLGSVRLSGPEIYSNPDTRAYTWRGDYYHFALIP